jgi:hypothetical protein
MAMVEIGMRNDPLFTIEGNQAKSLALSRPSDLFGVEATDTTLLHFRCHFADQSSFTDPGHARKKKDMVLVTQRKRGFLMRCVSLLSLQIFTRDCTTFDTA